MGDDFLQRCEDWRDGLRAAAALSAENALALDSALADARAGRLLAPPQPLLTIMLMGATGGGKSELLNALAGERIAESHHLRPTTTQPTIYLHQDVNPRQLYEYGTQLGDLAAGSGKVVTHARPELVNKVIVDAPDIDSYRTDHRERVMQLLPVVDVVLYVVTPFSYKDDLGWALVLRERGRRAFAFIMNKWDAEGRPGQADGPGADQDFVRLVMERAGYDNARIFLTSARWWATNETKRAGAAAPAPGENFQELRQWLERRISTSQVEQIQRRRRRSLWGALSAAIAHARLPKIDVAAARNLVLPELDALATEGVAMWRVVIEKRAEALSRRREEEGRPHSPGPFGRLSAFVSGLINLGSTWRKVAEPAPDATPDEIAETAQRSVRQAGQRMATIEWKLRETGVPAEGFADRAQAFLPELEARLRSGFEEASGDLLDMVTLRWKLVAGWIVLVVFELLTVGLLGLAAWRLVQAFIAGQYLDLRFTLNLLALLGILLATGSGVMAILFPPVKTRLRKGLEAAMKSQWRLAADRATVTVDKHLETMAGLHETGTALLHEADKQAGELTAEINATQDEEIARLF